FLPSELALHSSNNIYPEHLYQGVVSEVNNKLFWLGAQDQWLTFNMFDAQAWFVRDVILGRIELPTAEKQREHMDTWLQRFHSLETADDQIDFQTDYVRDLISQTDYPMFDLHEVARILKSWVQDKKDDIMGYRNATYRSVMTGTMAAKHHTEWVNELDSSLERYLNEPESDEVRDIWEGREAVQRR
ncbi:MAG TPA: NAD(P)/FAD-dependent oxidoreductase, partial [Corynebacterium sp.]|nr:NAD(P)/FAD-dependent oxidoreductase [Corynebacterium sp.]